jgi:hypothetical protein
MKTTVLVPVMLCCSLLCGCVATPEAVLRDYHAAKAAAFGAFESGDMAEAAVRLRRFLVRVDTAERSGLTGVDPVLDRAAAEFRLSQALRELGRPSESESHLRRSMDAFNEYCRQNGMPGNLTPEQMQILMRTL